MDTTAHGQAPSTRSNGSATIGQPPMVYGRLGHRNCRSLEASGERTAKHAQLTRAPNSGELKSSMQNAQSAFGSRESARLTTTSRERERVYPVRKVLQIPIARGSASLV